MKIGILTFHWATNYGAILQCYALQEYLKSEGHEVEIINYKPKLYDNSLLSFFLKRRFLKYKSYIDTKNKEKKLDIFRKRYLNLTNRLYHCNQLSHFSTKYDVVISGSDQVLNPTFLMNGEGKNKITPSYFLDFAFNGRKIGYALSFGCISYPDNASSKAKLLIKNFDSISVREKTGLKILKYFGRSDALVVPDPTLLQKPFFYEKIISGNLNMERQYIYSFFIRNINERKEQINMNLYNHKILWNNDDKDYTIEGWLSKIKKSKFVISDSFHCIVMCLKLHVPFVVVTENKGNIGMNDRFFTLLSILNLEKNIISKDCINMIQSIIMETTFDWNKIDQTLESFKKDGEAFIYDALHE